ncbi:MAG: hypothetical protein EHM33_23880 [Chloroflexi bacterium]|nr:MAG: hypothetical protein EHM33_23880 [Chloroflexota bacterium]
MAKKIDKDCDDVEAGIRFHMSSARMGIVKMSFVAFQRYLDRVCCSMYRCQNCGWGGSGKKLVPMETSEESAFSVDQHNDTWYACPQCESAIDPDSPVVSPVD